jgi:tetratricopeptide (TPR) repeat protein
MAKLNMLKNRSNKFIALASAVLLAACADTAIKPADSSLPTVATPPPTSTVDTKAVAAMSSDKNKPIVAVTALVAKPAVVLNAALQSKFDEGVKALDGGQFDRALQSFAAIQIAQANFAPAYLNAALAERGRGKLDAARTQLDGALTAGVLEARVYALMGLIERERGQFAAAKSAYEEAIKLDPNYAPAHRNLAVLADLYLHDATLAFQHMEKYVQMNPDDKQASGWLSELKRRAGIKTEAAQ